MKIIADCGENKYIVEMSGDEIANLIGYHSRYSNGANIQVGMEVKVTQLFNTLYNMQRNSEQLLSARGELNKALDALIPIDPILKEYAKPKQIK